MVGLALSSSCPSPSRFVGKQVAARSARNVPTASTRSAAAVCDPVVAEERFQVREKLLHPAQTPPVDQAAAWANEMVLRETRGPGDMPNAMQRLERRHDLPAKTLWSLRYRRPKDIFASLYFKLGQAYQAECQRQMRRLSHELEITRLTTGAAHPALASTEALVAADHA